MGLLVTNQTYPRVTEILKPFGSYEFVPPDILENAALRGTRVHAICANLAKGAWIPDSTIEPEYLGYIQSYRKWEASVVKKYSVIEKRYYHDGYGYTGQVDAVIQTIKNQLALVDFKTSAKPHKTHRVQMAAYVDMLFEHDLDVDLAMLVYLDKDGAYPRVEEHAHLIDELDVFLGALKCYYFFKATKRMKSCQNPHQISSPISTNVF